VTLKKCQMDQLLLLMTNLMVVYTGYTNNNLD
jgi:hypothetical protein